MVADKASRLSLAPPEDEPIFVRRGDFIVFNQLGVKLELDKNLSPDRYFTWLDNMRLRIGELVDGAKIVEKEYARTQPRLNTGVYYDTPERDLVNLGAVLRTTCNKLTHAFCALKEPETADGVRRDHRYVFEGEEKECIQDNPTSPDAVAIVKRLLSRDDVEHPGLYLRQRYGIHPAILEPSIRIAQLRHPFFVWLDGRDALRCVMDRAVVTDLRDSSAGRSDGLFLELELPLYPRIEPEVSRDPRTVRLINVLKIEAEEQLDAIVTARNKYQRAADVLELTGANR